MKHCPRCDETKDEAEFYLYSSGKRYAYCDPCRAKYVAGYVWLNVTANRAKALRWWHKTGDAKRKEAKEMATARVSSEA